MDKLDLKIRTVCVPNDLSRLLELAEISGFFYPHEVEVLRNLCQEHFDLGAGSDYNFVLIENGETVLGFSCYGSIEEAENNYDLYWMIVDPKLQGQGIGKLMMANVEEAVRQLGGRQINIETSSRELYLPTRKFYQGQGYLQSASLPDYYAVGDHKICYYKNL